VNYDMRNWQLLSNQLKSNPSSISLLNRAQILDDCLSLAHSGLLPYDFAFSMAEYMRAGETEFAPWQAYLNNLQYVSYMLQLTPAYPYLQVGLNGITLQTLKRCSIPCKGVEC